MKTGEAYSSAVCADKFDAIVIGSGISGLCAAALLAQRGKRTIVLEKHFKPGGFTHSFRRNQYEWDVGVHYIGEVHRERSVPRRLFDHISDGQLRWARMHPTYDRIVFPDRTYELTAPKEQFIAGLSGYFPQEKDAISRYMYIVGQVTRAARGFFAAKALPSFLGSAAEATISRKFRSFSDRTTEAVLSELTADARLRGVLIGQWGDYGLPPAQSSFAIQAIVARHYLDGANYPVGGARKMAETIVPVVEKGGGRVVVSAAVDEITIRGGKAAGVRLTNGDEISAPVVISAAGVINTYGRLLRNHSESAKFRRRLETVKPASGHICLHIGINHSAQDLGLHTANMWIYPGYDHDRNVSDYLAGGENEFPVVFVSFPSARDPLWEQEYPGTATLEAVTMAPYEWFEQWKERPWKKRGEDYERLKERLSGRLLATVEEHVPAIRGKIDYHELSTPLSTRDLVNYPLGEMYGIEHSPSRFRQKWLQPRTPIRNLFLTGQDITTVGVTGALLAGLLTASVVLKKNLLRDL